MVKKIIALLACAFLLPAAGCAPADGDGNGGTEGTVSMYRQVSGFETTEEFFPMDFENRFGQIRLNTDKSYVTEGSASAKLEVWGDFRDSTADPYMIVNLEGEETDLRRLRAVEFDLFNQSGADCEIGVALKADGFTTEYQYVSVKQGKNEISVSFDLVGVALAADLTAGEGVLLQFPKAADFEDAKTNLFYLDNMGFSLSLKEPTPLSIELDENEFCSFDKEYQKYMTVVGGVGPTDGCQPVLSINEDLNYVSGQSGKSLKVVLPTGLPPINDGWPYFTFVGSLFEAVDFAKYAEEGYSLAFDVYNTGADFNFGLEVQPADSTVSKGYSVPVTCPKGWSTHTFDLSAWNSNVTEERPVKLTDNVKEFWLSYSKFATADKVFYFDNFRFVKNA